LSRALARELGAEFVSLDTVKEQLWSSGVSHTDARALRLAAEAESLARAARAPGDVVLDIWVAPGRDDERVAGLLRAWEGPVVQIGCVVPAETAVARYVDRGRSGGPHGVTDEPLLQRILDAVPLMGSLHVGPYLEVDTSLPVDVAALVRRVVDSAP
jgi:predicted kinase